MAGTVTVQLLFVESNGATEPSTENWTQAQMAAVEAQIQKGLDWWVGRLPNARLSFNLVSQTATTGYEPIKHTIGDEGRWIGDALASLGYTGSSYFEQAYSAAEALRREHGTNWATTIVMANSDHDADGRFADNYFAYAYIGGPFMVLTSDAGGYTTNQLAPVFSHELGHIFGALDQYAEAAAGCNLRSGYLSVPHSNSQFGNCGTHNPSIMWEPLNAFRDNSMDSSALGQVGYRDSDGDSLPDPLDTEPVLRATLSVPQTGRPQLSAVATDKAYPSPEQSATTINTIASVEYRVDGGPWSMLPAADDTYGSSSETVQTALPLYDGVHVVDLRAVNTAGNSSAIQSSTVTVRGVGSEPTYAVSGASLTNSPSVTLEIAAPAGSQLRIASTPTFAGAAWVTAAPTLNWSVPAEDGSHILYIVFRDSAGTESPLFSHTIILDRQPPSGRASLPNQNNMLEIQAHDNISGVEAVQILAPQGNSDWLPYQSTLALPQAQQAVQVRLRDGAGNISAPLLVERSTTIHLPLIQSR